MTISCLSHFPLYFPRSLFVIGGLSPTLQMGTKALRGPLTSHSGHMTAIVGTQLPVQLQAANSTGVPQGHGGWVWAPFGCHGDCTLSLMMPL